MPLYSNTSTFFTPNQHIFVHHDTANVFESNFYNIQGQTIVLTHVFDFNSGAESHSYFTLLVFVFHEVMNQQQNDVVRIHKISFIVIKTNSIGIAIRCQTTRNGTLVFDKLTELYQIFVYGFRRLTMKPGIVITMQFIDVWKQSLHHTLSGTIHGIIGQIQS